jgi:hypothetical protein
MIQVLKNNDNDYATGWLTVMEKSILLANKT